MADRQEVSFPKKIGREVGKPRKSSAHFPLVEVPASKEKLKYGGFLQRIAILWLRHIFHQDLGMEHTTHKISHTSNPNILVPIS